MAVELRMFMLLHTSDSMRWCKTGATDQPMGEGVAIAAAHCACGKRFCKVEMEDSLSRRRDWALASAPPKVREQQTQTSHANSRGGAIAIYCQLVQTHNKVALHECPRQSRTRGNTAFSHLFPRLFSGSSACRTKLNRFTSYRSCSWARTRASRSGSSPGSNFAQCHFA